MVVMDPRTILQYSITPLLDFHARAYLLLVLQRQKIFSHRLFERRRHLFRIEFLLRLAPVVGDHFLRREFAFPRCRLAFEHHAAALAIAQLTFDLRARVGAKLRQRFETVVVFPRFFTGQVAVIFFAHAVAGFIALAAAGHLRGLVILLALALLHHLFKKLLSVDECAPVQGAGHLLIETIEQRLQLLLSQPLAVFALLARTVELFAQLRH